MSSEHPSDRELRRRELQRRANGHANGTPMPPKPVSVIEPELAKVFAQLGAGFIDQGAAVAIFNSAVMLGGDKAPLLVSAIAAGAVIKAVDEVITKLCGPPPDPENPLAALPEWALEMLKRCGVIKPQPVAEDPNAPPKPVESLDELHARATKAGIVIP